jgi:hypothetical protein
MKFLDGFLLVNFIPFAVLAILGLILFFIKTRQTEKYYYPLLFIIVILCVVSLIRFPFADIARRYTMPLLVPGIIISTLTLMLLPSLLKQFKIPYGKAIIRTALAIVLIICVAKALRVQEQKPYLRDIAEVIEADCKKNNVPKAALLIFGNPGGHIDVDDNVTKIEVPKKNPTDKFTDANYQLSELTGSLDLDVLKNQYAHIYMLCIEATDENFLSSVQNKYGFSPELFFEYTRQKDSSAYRIYRLRSTLKSAWLSNNELHVTTIKNNDLLNNEILIDKYQVSKDCSELHKLRERGIIINDGRDIFLPLSWKISYDHGWDSSCSPVVINSNLADGKGIAISSKSMVGFYIDKIFRGNKTYVINIETEPFMRGDVWLYAYCYSPEGHFLKNIKFMNVNKQNIIASISIQQGTDVRFALTVAGDINIKKFKITDI